jgi:hypothetical protein
MYIILGQEGCSLGETILGGGLRCSSGADCDASYCCLFRYNHCTNGQGRVPQEGQTIWAVPRCASKLLT